MTDVNLGYIKVDKVEDIHDFAHIVRIPQNFLHHFKSFLAFLMQCLSEYATYIALIQGLCVKSYNRLGAKHDDLI